MSNNKILFILLLIISLQSIAKCEVEPEVISINCSKSLDLTEDTSFNAYFALDEEIYHDIANMYHVNLERDDAVSMANGVELRVPFLDNDIIDLALDIPGIYKIKDNEDILRKHILRDVAKSIGVPDYIADRPKKAAQYGSGINKILKKRVLKSFDMGEFIDSLKNK